MPRSCGKKRVRKLHCANFRAVGFFFSREKKRLSTFWGNFLGHLTSRDGNRINKSLSLRLSTRAKAKDHIVRSYVNQTEPNGNYIKKRGETRDFFSQPLLLLPKRSSHHSYRKSETKKTKYLSILDRPRIMINDFPPLKWNKLRVVVQFRGISYPFEMMERHLMKSRSMMPTRCVM